jgi:hypothetical protein
MELARLWWQSLNPSHSIPWPRTPREERPNDLDDYTLSSPAISDGQIFIRTTKRTTKFLYCIGDRTVQVAR